MYECTEGEPYIDFMIFTAFIQVHEIRIVSVVYVPMFIHIGITKYIKALMPVLQLFLITSHQHLKIDPTSIKRFTNPNHQNKNSQNINKLKAVN